MGSEAGKVGTAGTGSSGGALDLSDSRRDVRRNEKPRCGAAPSTAAELAAIVLDTDEQAPTIVHSYLEYTASGVPLL